MPIHLLEELEPNVPPDDEWFAPSELATLATLRFAKRREDWRLGRWTTKNAVSSYLKVPSLARIEIRPAVSGAPEVFIEGKPASVSVSLSHRDGVALCALTEAGVSVGCDLEAIEQRSDAFISDYLAAEEQAYIAKASQEERALLANLIWSAKESALKVLRTGLRLDTRTVVVTLEDQQQPRDRRAMTSSEEFAAATSSDWQPFHARNTDTNQIFHGWWQRSGSLLRTVAMEEAVPPPEWLERLQPLR